MITDDLALIRALAGANVRPRVDAKGSSALPFGMAWIEAALWGLSGGFAVEGLDLYGAVRRRGCWPWRAGGPREVGAVGYVVAEMIRLLIGSVLASALAESGQITTAFGALAVGVAAPLIVERLARAIPLTDSGQHAESVPTDKWLPAASGSELNGQGAPVEARRACTDEGEKVARQGDQPDRAEQ